MSFKDNKYWITLADMSPWEKVEFVLRRHWIMYFYLFIRFLMALIVSSFALMVNHPLVHIFLILFWMWFWIYIYIAWLNHELDLFVITNNRIVWVEQIAFLNRTVSECNLWQVQEVNSQTKWILSNILNYWLITIQTAWNTSNFEMDWAPNAMRSSRKILNIVDHYRDLEREKWWSRNWWLWEATKTKKNMISNKETLAKVVKSTKENVENI